MDLRESRSPEVLLWRGCDCIDTGRLPLGSVLQQALCRPLCYSWVVALWQVPLEAFWA